MDSFNSWMKFTVVSLFCSDRIKDRLYDWNNIKVSFHTKVATNVERSSQSLDVGSVMADSHHVEGESRWITHFAAWCFDISQYRSWVLQTGRMDEPDPSGDQDKHLVRVRMKKSELRFTYSRCTGGCPLTRETSTFILNTCLSEVILRDRWH